jgi:hypothetical protein
MGSTGGGLVTATVSMGGLQVAPNTRTTFALSAVITDLPPGTYQVGLCGTAPNPNAPWNSNGAGFTSAIVF